MFIYDTSFRLEQLRVERLVERSYCGLFIALFLFFYIFYVGIRDVVIIVSSQEETDTACTGLSCFVSYRLFLLAMLLLDRSHFGNSLQYEQSKDLVYFFFFFNA